MIHLRAKKVVPCNFPDLYGGIATQTCRSDRSSPSERRQSSWNCPDLYGGLATFFKAGRSHGLIIGPDLGTALICTVGLRLNTSGNHPAPGLKLGTALICTVGLRLSLA